ncbi:hypothetical protein M9435_004947 [Picochlorum sp. BPE23]|nr:hypothetical protein M9435_004947 [Picochlorum sp. BPE23]
MRVLLASKRILSPVTVRGPHAWQVWSRFYGVESSHRNLSYRLGAHDTVNAILKQHRRRRHGFSCYAAEVDDVFFSNVTFSENGVAHEMCGLLEEAGFTTMSKAQRDSYAALRKGGDVVLAAETGSGKTMAYLVPLIENLIDARGDDRGDVDDDIMEESVVEELRSREHASSVLVLCPNAVLCKQVVDVIDSIYGGSDLIKAVYVSAQQISYDDSREGFPDVVVTTPGALHSLLNGTGPLIGPEWTMQGLKDWARFVVLDEADMLLGGAYGKSIEHLMGELRGGDRERAALRACEEVGISLDDYWSMPRHIRKAAQLYGGRGMVEEGACDFIEGRRPGDDLNPSNVWLRQYCFVGATMPTEGKETVGAKIAKEFPTSTWISGQQLHKTMQQVEFRWESAHDGERHKHDVLIDIIQSDEEIQQGSGRVMVFTKDTKSCKSMATMLSNALAPEGDDASSPLVLQYHKGSSQAEREESLRYVQMRGDTSRSFIFVCTDATARGLDVPGVSHVVHADFPASAVDFLHRSGRTGRAGLKGVVTAIVDEDGVDLANAIRELIQDDGSIEGAFSRNRSFRKKFKKYGEFVPRGALKSDA